MTRISTRKIILATLLALLLIIFTGAFMVGCSDDEHEHSYTTELVAPTCESAGYERMVCSCGDTKMGQTTLPAVGHNYVNDKCTKCQHEREHTHSHKATLVKPTCVAEGYLLHECKCGDTYKGETIPALGHSFVGMECERCGVEKNHVHNYIPRIVNATCTKEGYIVNECSCGDSFTSPDKIPALGHNFVNDVCDRCGQTRTHIHNYVKKVELPTCTKAGKVIFECACGDSYLGDEKLYALGHHYVDNKCDACGYEKTQMTIYLADISLGGNKITEHRAEAFAKENESLAFGVIINHGEDMSDYLAPAITWSIVGESYGSSISQEGVLSLAPFVGQITIKATIKGENELEVTIPVIQALASDTSVTAISVTTKDTYTQEYIEGEVFNRESIIVWGETKSGLVRLSDFTTEDKKLTPDKTDIDIYYGSLATDLPIVVRHRLLQSIEVEFPSTKTQYLEGETFDKTGLIVKAYFENLETLIMDYEVDTTTPLTRDTTSVTITYNYNGVIKTVEQQITVVPKKLLSISLNADNVRRLYTQGDSFDATGLVVKAKYESFGEVEVTGYEFSSDALTIDDKTIEIFFTDGEITKSEKITIEVVSPYTKISSIKVMNPKDVSILWTYSYTTAEGERIIDNTAFEANGLTYDKVNGEYEIPMGAVVTVTIKNPSVMTLSLNNEEQVVRYEEKTVSFTMGDAQVVVLKSINMAGEYSTVRFFGQENEQSFLFNEGWDGYLDEESLLKLQAVFANTENHYYTYLVNGELKTFEQLEAIELTGGTEITVLKNAVGSGVKELLLHVGENEAYSIWVKDDVLLSDIPTFTKPGYDYDGWALTDGGDKIGQQELTALIEAQSDSYNLYIRLVKQELDYSDEYINQEGGSPTFGGNTGEGSVQFVGAWGSSVVNEGNTLAIEVVFNKDGSFKYTVTYNGEVNCEFTGIYRIDGTEIVVISVSSESDGIANVSDFEFVLKGDKISTNLIVVTSENGYTIVPYELQKQATTEGE